MSKVLPNDTSAISVRVDSTMAVDNQDLGARLSRFDVKRGPDGGHYAVTDCRKIAPAVVEFKMEEACDYAAPSDVCAHIRI